MSWLRPLPDGRLDYQGIAGPHLEIVARSDETLVAWQPGYRSNFSGIRGMRDDVYWPGAHIVFRIEKVEKSGALRVTKLVEWQGRGERGKAKARGAA